MAETPSEHDPMTVKVITQNFGNPEARHLVGYEKLGGYKSLRKAMKMTHAEVIEEVKKANLRGRGGAGFPAGVKWGFIPKDAQTIYLVVNFDEGEPGTFKDRTLTGWDPHRLVEGAAIAGYAIRAHHVFIYIRGELWEHARILEEAIEEAYAKQYLGANLLGSGWALDMVVHRGAGAYICGEVSPVGSPLFSRPDYNALRCSRRGLARFGGA